MEADVSGAQRKVIDQEVRPARATQGDRGIPLREGSSMPFKVDRSWSAPAGHYLEAFYLVDPETREVLYEGPAVERSVWGLQAITTFTSTVKDAIRLRPGTYSLVFALGGQMGGEFPVEAFEVSAEEAA